VRGGPLQRAGIAWQKLARSLRGVGETRRSFARCPALERIRKRHVTHPHHRGVAARHGRLSERPPSSSAKSLQDLSRGVVGTMHSRRETRVPYCSWLIHYCVIHCCEACPIGANADGAADEDDDERAHDPVAMGQRIVARAHRESRRTRLAGLGRAAISSARAGARRALSFLFSYSVDAYARQESAASGKAFTLNSPSQQQKQRRQP
jgi:hypothetical protein